MEDEGGRSVAVGTLPAGGERAAAALLHGFSTLAGPHKPPEIELFPV